MTGRVHHDNEPTATVTLTDETLTDIYTFPEDMVRSMDTVAVEIVNTVTALDQFVVLGKVSENGAYVVLADAAADFTESTMAKIIRAARPVLTSLGVATGILVVDVRGLYGLKLQAARAAGGNSVLTIRAGGD